MGPYTDTDADLATEQVENFGGIQDLVGGRKRGSRKSKGRGRRNGRGRKGGSFLAEITVPAGLLAATQYMKGRSSYRRTKRRSSRRRSRGRSVRRRR